MKNEFAARPYRNGTSARALCSLLLLASGATSAAEGQSIITREDLVNASIDAEGRLVVTPSATSSRHDYDFFVGRWKVHHRKLEERLVGSTEWIEYEGTDHDKKILNGLGHTNNNRGVIDGRPYEGVGLTLFSPETRLWSVYWANSRSGVLDWTNPVVGSFEGDIGTFYAQDVYDGKEVLVMARWDKSDPDHAVWSQAFSEDEGETWEWNWFMHEHRVPDDEEALREELLTIDTTLPIPEAHFDDDGELVITASEDSSKHDFDFLSGKWTMYHKKLAERFVGSTEWVDLQSTDVNYGPILDGIGNTDLYVADFDGRPFEGFTLRLFNPETRLWSLFWVDSESAVLDPPVVGSFDGDIGHFFGEDTVDGRDVLVVFRWDFRDKARPVWSQAFSLDRGKTWEWNWINVMYRVE